MQAPGPPAPSQPPPVIKQKPQLNVPGGCSSLLPLLFDTVCKWEPVCVMGAGLPYPADRQHCRAYAYCNVYALTL